MFPRYSINQNDCDGQCNNRNETLVEFVKKKNLKSED